jgi:peptidoglycan/LPS O-acetylase OafA/YrhL
MFCKDKTPAFERYQRRVQIAMGVYVVVILGASYVLKLGSPHWLWLYFWSVLPAVPVIAVFVAVGRYLQEEKDEYQRLKMTQALLVGTAALLTTVIVNDFVQTFAHTVAFPPFTSFMIFAAACAIVQGVQRLRDRVSNEGNVSDE